MAGMTGVALIAAECLTSLEDMNGYSGSWWGRRLSAALWQHSDSGPVSIPPTICA